MEQDDFKKNIDELFRLFNKLVDRSPMDEIPGVNKFQFEQMKIFLKNYESMKNDLSFEMMGHVNEPMKQMIKMFIKQLRQELGETEDLTIEIETVKAPLQSIEKIDELLRQPGLSEDEINNLLDERAILVSKKNDAAMFFGSIDTEKYKNEL